MSSFFGLPLLHTRLAGRGGLQAFGSPQAFALCLLLHSLVVLCLGFACGSLALCQMMGTLIRVGLFRIAVNAAWGYRRPRRSWYRCGARALALPDVFETLGCTLLALGLIPHGLALAQHSLGIACMAPGLAQAVFNGETLVAISLGLPQSLGDGLPLLAHGLSPSGPGRRFRGCGNGSRTPVLRQHLGPGGHGHESGAQEGQRDCPLHVNPVSTTRRSRARYSLDCISLRRETVRGNSCTSGPSV